MATGVDPEVYQAVLLGLFSAKFELAVPSFGISCTALDILKSDFVRSPSVRKDGVGQNLVRAETDQDIIFLASKDASWVLEASGRAVPKTGSEVVASAVVGKMGGKGGNVGLLDCAGR
jgi:hypothetical protein